MVTKKMIEALKPCPFCGGSDVHLRHHQANQMSWVSCVGCGLEAPSETGVSDDEAVTYWNRRAEATLLTDAEPVKPLYENDAVWARFYRDGKNLGEICSEFGCGVYDLSPWLTAPLARTALSAQVQDVAGLVEVVEAMARFDGRNNNAALKKMAKDALVAYRAAPSAKQEGVDRSKLRPIFDDAEGRN